MTSPLDSKAKSPWQPTAALLVAGLGWGTTGLFVRVLSRTGANAYQLLSLRLLVAGLLLMIVYVTTGFRNRTSRVVRKATVWPTAGLGLSMLLYYLGAITAFQNLRLSEAALLIGFSPAIAWCFQPTKRAGIGVLIAIVGLALLAHARTLAGPVSGNGWIGVAGALLASSLTVFNARWLRSMAQMSRATPTPLAITAMTSILGLVSTAVFAVVTGEAKASLHMTRSLIDEMPFQVLGFGLIATVLPGWLMAFASSRLRPVVTSTVSIQLQIWTAALGWLILGEAMTGPQVFYALLAASGLWLCIRG